MLKSLRKQMKEKSPEIIEILRTFDVKTNSPFEALENMIRKNYRKNDLHDDLDKFVKLDDDEEEEFMERDEGFIESILTSEDNYLDPEDIFDDDAFPDDEEEPEIIKNNKDAIKIYRAMQDLENNNHHIKPKNKTALEEVGVDIEYFDIDEIEYDDSIYDNEYELSIFSSNEDDEDF